MVLIMTVSTAIACCSFMSEHFVIFQIELNDIAFIVRRKRAPTNQVVFKSHVSPMPFDTLDAILVGTTSASILCYHLLVAW